MSASKAGLGLVVRHVSTLAPGLHGYAVSVWECGAVRPEEVRLSATAGGAVLQAVRDLAAEGHRATWVCGRCITRAVARSLRMRLRKRVPGGGRKATSELVAVSVWMTPAGKDGLDAKHAAADRAAGKVRGLGRFIEEDFVGLYAD